MSIPAAWSQVLDFFGTPPASQQSNTSSSAGGVCESVEALTGAAA
jgi:hypothetical protein